MHVLISEVMDAPAVDALRQRFDVRYAPDLVEQRDALLQAAGQADALIVRNRSQVDAALLAAAPRLRANSPVMKSPGAPGRLPIVSVTGAQRERIAAMLRFWCFVQ